MIYMKQQHVKRKLKDIHVISISTISTRMEMRMSLWHQILALVSVSSLILSVYGLSV